MMASATRAALAALFGDALGVTTSDLAGQAILTLVVVAVALALYRPLLSLSFNAEKAELWNMKPRRAHAALLVLIAVAVVGVRSDPYMGGRRRPPLSGRGIVFGDRSRSFGGHENLDLNAVVRVRHFGGLQCLHKCGGACSHAVYF